MVDITITSSLDCKARLKPGRRAKPKVKSTWVRCAPRPNVWVVGPDEDRHRMYQPWLVSKAQANFRGEEWELEFEEYYQLWKNDWDNRGRQPDDMCMTRIDKEGAWAVGNVHVITRREHLIEQGRSRKGQAMIYKPRYTKLKV